MSFLHTFLEFVVAERCLVGTTVHGCLLDLRSLFLGGRTCCEWGLSLSFLIGEYGKGCADAGGFCSHALISSTMPRHSAAAAFILVACYCLLHGLQLADNQNNSVDGAGMRGHVF